MTPRWRSLLFAAADDHNRLSKIADRQADAIILDLEDAVPTGRKAAAREGLAAVVDRLHGQGCSIVVRINADWRGAIADIAAAVRQGVTAIMVPKVEDTARLSVIEAIVAEYAADAGVADPPGLIALIESPAALHRLTEIANVPTVIGLALGSEDFSLALGVPPSPQALDLPTRCVAIAAAERKLMALGLPCSIATIKDEQAWAHAVSEAKAIGITGALCIHPKQIAPVNSGFALGTDEVDAARRLIAAWEKSDQQGVMQFEGRMVDKPVVLAALRLIEQSEA